jgi:NADPH:quinone reductase-like Zn-dependent oxidoreductase
MNAAIIHTLGQPPRYGEFKDPTPAENEKLIHVRAAGLHQLVKAVAAGKHYSGTPDLPFIPGVDCVGTLDDGSRVYCGFPRRPFGTMAERTVVPAHMCIPLPDGLDDVTAAALGNPGMSAWLSLSWKAKIAPGETVLILGATGSAGQLAVQFAKLLGATRVIAAGRNQAALDGLKALGADATIQLDQPTDALVAAFAAEAGNVNVVIDYLWGPPTEAFLQALAQQPTLAAGRRVRLVEVGSMAGPNITLPGALLRSQGLEISGSGLGSASLDRIMQAIPEFFALAATGKIKIDTNPTPLSQVESAWTNETKGSRTVFTL